MMNVFEPLFLFLVLVTLVTLLAAAAFAILGNRARAGRILKRVGIGAAIYVAIVIAVSIVNPRREYRVGDMQCFDDWCITVESARRPARGPYVVQLRLSNRARRVPMGENGTVVYLTDAQGRRYDPLPDPEAIPFSKTLQPGESVLTFRRFDVPPDAHDLGLIYRLEGGFPIGWLIISEGGWFQKPPIVHLD